MFCLLVNTDQELSLAAVGAVAITYGDERAIGPTKGAYLADRNAIFLSDNGAELSLQQAADRA